MCLPPSLPLKISGKNTLGGGLTNTHQLVQKYLHFPTVDETFNLSCVFL